MEKDWRIGYYFDLAMTKMNERILQKGLNKDFLDSVTLNKWISKEHKKDKTLSKLDILKLIIQNIKEGMYDKN